MLCDASVSVSNEVRGLELSSKFLAGNIPSEFGLLTQLVHIDIASNSLTGQIPNELWAMTQLEVLSLYFNDLSGTFPHDVTQLTRLKRFEFGDDFHTGSIPDLGPLSNLETLYFSRTDSIGPFPTLTDWTNLGEAEIVLRC